jgi:predicted metal-dependent hydrolase
MTSKPLFETMLLTVPVGSLMIDVVWTQKPVKNMTLRYQRQRLLLTAPANLTEHGVHRLIHHKADWIKKHWPTTPMMPWALPAQWVLNDDLYVWSDLQKYHPKPTSYEGMLGQAPSIQKQYVAAGIKAYAKAHFPDELRMISQRASYPAFQCRISDGQTQWGSCSSKRMISLNWRLS